MLTRSRILEQRVGHVRFQASLYGSKPQYTNGALRLAKRVHSFNRKCYTVSLRIFHDASVPCEVLAALEAIDVELRDMSHLQFKAEQRSMWRLMNLHGAQTVFIMDLDGDFFQFFMRTERYWLPYLGSATPAVASILPNWLTYGKCNAPLPAGYLAFVRAEDSPALMALSDQVLAAAQDASEFRQVHYGKTREFYGIDEFVLGQRLLPRLMAEGTPVFRAKARQKVPYCMFEQLEPSLFSDVWVRRNAVPDAALLAELRKLCDHHVAVCDRVVGNNADLLFQAQSGRLDSIALVGTNRRQYRLPEDHPVVAALVHCVRRAEPAVENMHPRTVNLFRLQPNTSSTQIWHRDEFHAMRWVVSLATQGASAANGQTQILPGSADLEVDRGHTTARYSSSARMRCNGLRLPQCPPWGGQS